LCRSPGVRNLGSRIAQLGICRHLLQFAAKFGDLLLIKNETVLDQPFAEPGHCTVSRAARSSWRPPLSSSPEDETAPPRNF
jgi:hypothetical protein